jgi:hypothetical protein
MSDLGWGDPIESQILLAYRRKGESREHSFHGAVAVLGEDRKTLTWLKREDLPLREGRLDLSNVPVVGIGGKRKQQPGRAQSFLESNPDFQGALLLYPGTGNWDLGVGMIFVSSREVMSGRRVSGGRPEVQLTNYRWLRDGRYVADRAKVLHNKVLEVLEAELEQETTPEAIVQAIAGWQVPHRLRYTMEEVSGELFELETRRVIFTDEQMRDMTALVQQCLTKKLQEAGIRFVRDIPETFTVAAEEIAPELVSQRDTIGTVIVPGVGRRLPKKRSARFGFSGNKVPVVELSIEEFRLVDAWPFATVYPVLNGFGEVFEQVDYGLQDAMEAPEADRLAKLREYFTLVWLNVQRGKNCPKDEKVTNPLEADPPTTPNPVVWGFDLMTDEAQTVYAALHHSVGVSRGRVVDSGWSICWYDDAKQAAIVDTKARREAESFIMARKLETELTAEGNASALPVELPAMFVPFTLTQVMERLGFTAEQFRVEGEGPEWQCVAPAKDYYSKLKETFVTIERARYANRWWRKQGDVIVVFANTSINHLVDEDVGAAEQFGVSKDKLQNVRSWLASERQKAEDDYRAQVREFVKKLQERSAHASLSSDAQVKLASLADRYELPSPSRIVAEFRSEWAKAETLQRRVESGEILTNFGGHFRVMGATGNVQYWVIMPDGSERDADEVNYRKRYTSEGEKKWRLVGPEELAIMWSKAYTAAPHEFVVIKYPDSGCTPEQLSAVKRIECEISKLCYGTDSVEIAGGWELRKKSSPKAMPEPDVLAEPVDLTKIDLSRLFGGGGITKNSRK